jgi:RNase P subunit RPR2
MSERDPLGEKIRMKERAEEDQYFAARDRELMAKLKDQQEAERTATSRELARARCPDCGDFLQPYPIQHRIIQECPTCHGAWLSRTQMEQVAQQQGKGWTEKFLADFVYLLEHPKM